MAKQPEPSAAPAAEGAPAKKKKPILIIAIVVLVLLVGGGAAAWFLLGGKHGKEDEHAEEVEASKPPVYVTLEPFTVNLTSEASDRYLQVGIDLKVSAPDIEGKVKLHLPEIRNGILLLLTSKKVDDLASIEGKNTLRTEIRDIVNKAIGYYKAPAAPKPTIEKTDEHGGDKPPEEKPADKPAEEAGGEKAASKPPKNGVIDVLLTSFVIQ
ncbi:MAG: flagellar basal body-associated FliL family protein [Burkholderiales bacterium]|nr:flagellar basal body-associated FliL family protein [Burkholderiales bacterium]